MPTFRVLPSVLLPFSSDGFVSSLPPSVVALFAVSFVSSLFPLSVPQAANMPIASTRTRSSASTFFNPFSSLILLGHPNVHSPRFVHDECLNLSYKIFLQDTIGILQNLEKISCETFGGNSTKQVENRGEKENRKNLKKVLDKRRYAWYYIGAVCERHKRESE